MSTILFECDVTEYSIIPPKRNTENSFCLNDDCLVINIMAENKIITQTEISKGDAVELAKLILLKFNFRLINS